MTGSPTRVEGSQLDDVGLEVSPSVLAQWQEQDS